MFIAILHRIIFFSSISLFIAHFLGKHTQYKGEPAECIFFLCFQTNKTPTNGKWNLRTRQNMQIITCRQRWENFLASGCWTCTLIQSVYQSRRIELCPFCAYIYIYITPWTIGGNDGVNNNGNTTRSVLDSIASIAIKLRSNLCVVYKVKEQ